MIIHVQKRTNPYVMIDEGVLKDTRISFDARGLMAYLLSKPSEYVVSVKDLIEASPDGEKKVQRILRELSAYGYAELRPVMGAGRTFAGKSWVINEVPMINADNTSDSRYHQKGGVGNREVSDTALLGSSGKPTVGKTDRREKAACVNVPINSNNVINNVNVNVDEENFLKENITSVAPISPLPPNSAPPPPAPRGVKTFSEWGASREEFCRLVSQHESAITEDAACTLYDRLGKWNGGAATSANWVKTAVTIWRDDEKKKAQQGQQKQTQQQKSPKSPVPDFTSQDRYKRAKNG